MANTQLGSCTLWKLSALLSCAEDIFITDTGAKLILLCRTGCDCETIVATCVCRYAESHCSAPGFWGYSAHLPPLLSAQGQGWQPPRP